MLFLEPSTSETPAKALSVASDDLYSVSPRPGRAQPANYPSLPFDPVREDVKLPERDAPSSSVHSPSTLAAATPERLIDVDEDESETRSESRAHSTATESFGFHTDSDTDEFASLPGTEAPSETRSGHRSQSSERSSVVEVEDIDIESMDSDDDGIRTPGSWTDVGSDAGESQRSGSDSDSD